MDPKVLAGAQLLVNVYKAAEREILCSKSKKNSLGGEPSNGANPAGINNFADSSQLSAILSSNSKNNKGLKESCGSISTSDAQKIETQSPPNIFSSNIAPTISFDDSQKIGFINPPSSSALLGIADQMENQTPIEAETSFVSHANEIVQRLKCSPPKRYYKSVFVGTTTPHRIKGTIKRKFSWKNYPELENLLISRRAEYLKISFEHNYTPYQKEYNNMLTEQVLERASSEGYVFERFSFPQLRDRVRSYFKSYLQAVKKGKISPPLN